MKINKIHKKINCCRVSGNKNLQLVAKFPNMSLTGIFPKTKKKVLETPMEVVFCNKSKLLQLNHNYKSEYLYGKSYGYRSSLNPVMIEHLKKKSHYLNKVQKLKQTDNMLDIGSNDGTFLNFFSCQRFGVDPSLRKLKNFYDKEIHKIPYTFEKGFSKIKEKKFKLISAIAMFYDIPKPVEFLKYILKILSKDGIFHIEVAYLPTIIKKFSYDTFCQEHYEYYSMMSLNYIARKANMKILDFGFNSINGGSVWVNLASNESQLKQKSRKIQKILKYEIDKKIHMVGTYKKFFKKVFKHSNKLKEIILRINKSGKKIVGLGASTKGNVLLQLSKIDNNDLKCIYDVNKEKFLCYTPKNNIMILNERYIKKYKPDYILILIWHFKDFLIKKIKKKLPRVKIIIPFPKIKII
jgi:hypothetical protein